MLDEMTDELETNVPTETVTSCPEATEKNKKVEYKGVLWDDAGSRSKSRNENHNSRARHISVDYVRLTLSIAKKLKSASRHRSHLSRLSYRISLRSATSFNLNV